MKKEKYTIDFFHYYEGYETDQNWNRFECPLFEKNTCIEICKDLQNDEQINDFMFIGKNLIVLDTDNFEDVIKPINDLYPLGSFAWCWVKKEDE